MPRIGESHDRRENKKKGIKLASVDLEQQQNQLH
jgi:hypothetical protein